MNKWELFAFKCALLAAVAMAFIMAYQSMVHGATMTDAQALAKAQMIWGDQARTWIERAPGTTRIKRLIGYDVAGIPHPVAWGYGSYEAAFSALPATPLQTAPGTVLQMLPHVQCLTDPTLFKTDITPFGSWTVPDIFNNCALRVYTAIQKTRAIDPAWFDAQWRPLGVWITP